VSEELQSTTRVAGAARPTIWRTATAAATGDGHGFVRAEQHAAGVASFDGVGGSLGEPDAAGDVELAEGGEVDESGGV
jgi:hypothetical protein